jgi:hypothetical protein
MGGDRNGSLFPTVSNATKSDSTLPHSTSRFTAWLERGPAPIFVITAVLAAFCTYFSMYAFRKPFAAAKFQGETLWGTAIGLKTAIVVSQIIGYALSKYIGIKFCSEITPGRRARTLVFLILWAELALVAFGLVPNGWKVFPIFLNGLPLGMVWGLVVWYLEGRRTSDVLLVGLSCSFIVSSGIVKDVGRAMMEGAVATWWQQVPLIGPWIGSHLGKVSEGWMPAITGLHFLPVFLGSVWLLNQLPRPNARDEEERSKRVPMKGSDRLAFVREFLFGMTMLCIAYLFLTAYRDFRDNYQVEIMEDLGYPYAKNKAIISKAETLVMFGVMAALALLYFVRDNRRGLQATYAIMIVGVLLLGGATALLQAKLISGFWWMTLTGLGSYLTYVPYNSVLFDRTIASTRATATAVFAIYLADAIGYTGSVGVQLFKDVAWKTSSRLAFFQSFTWVMCAVGTLCLFASAIYFERRSQQAAAAGKAVATK